MNTPRKLTWTATKDVTIEVWADAPMAFSVRRIECGTETAREMYTTELQARVCFERQQECNA